MVLATFRRSRCIQPEWAQWCPFTNKGRIPLFLLGTGCHEAVSFPLPKCERCVKRGELAPLRKGNLMYMGFWGVAG